ncbi:helix-turn-helix domain-containing protein [Clostridium thermosuccinogenes]|uniref:helix-turn-helix domain-containing protein n=1 Tax=Clostridium thermosuccinogenes TaxID=84032 RepID=UPI000CCC3964|nr:helix-turn-helix domain-containing protein [Pseudoclostridium thermosuccinogenes]PNT90248.1 hypothetical protein CDQ83_20030 [Pseudoclostridium thermosuccinogenes]
MGRIIRRLKKKVNPLFIKILFYFLSLIILVFIMGMTAYFNSVQQMKEDFSDKIMMNLQTSVNIIDNNLRTAQEISLNFFYDETVQMHFKPAKDLTISDKVYLSKIGGILSRNKSLLGNFIDNIFVYVDDDSVFTSDGKVDFMTFFNKFYRYDNSNTEFWKKYLKTNKYLEILPLVKVDKNYDNSANVIPIIFTSVVNGYRMVMVLNISADEIYMSIQKNTLIPSTGFIVLDSADNVILSSDERFRKTENIERYRMLFGDNIIGSGEFEIDGTKTIVSFLKSANYGWSYYLFTPMDEFEKSAKNVLSLTIMFCLILAGIGTIFSIIFTARIYNPIRKIRDTLRENEETSRMHYDSDKRLNDFELINLEIDSLKRQKIQFKAEHELLLRDYLDNSFIYLVEGNNMDQTDVIENIMSKKLNFSLGGYICCNVLLEFKEAFYKEIQDVDRINVLSGFKKMIKALMGEYVNLHVAEYRQNAFICIIDAGKNGIEEAVKKAAYNVINCFKNDTRYCDIYIGIGKRYDNINDIAKSYADAATALANRHKTYGAHVIDSYDLSIENNVFFSIKDEIKVNNLLHVGDYKGLMELLNDIVYNNIARGVSHEFMVKLFISLYNSGLRFIAEKKMNVDQFMTKEELDIMEQYQWISVDYANTLELLCEFFKRIMEKTHQKSKDRESDMAAKIAAYVESNYDKDLYLEKIADEMGVSIKYISKVFKCKTGMNLTDYISRIRVEKIKELLRNTDMNIGDISKEVGIFSRATFVRTFKKIEGITPSEYREMYRKNNKVPSGTSIC